MYHRWSRSITVEVDIDDVLSDIDTEDLERELKSRQATELDKLCGNTFKDFLQEWMNCRSMPSLFSMSENEICEFVLAELKKEV